MMLTSLDKLETLKSQKTTVFPHDYITQVNDIRKLQKPNKIPLL
jgi:hypothetical protein